MASVSSTMNEEKKPKKKTVPKVVRDLSWNKWIGEDIAKSKCFCCEINEIRMNSFHCGHVLAEANGGKMTVDNLRPICAACNTSMGTENLEEFKKRCGFGVSTPTISSVAMPNVSSIPTTNSIPTNEEVVSWYPGILFRSSPKYIRWQKGTNSLQMMQELQGRYTSVNGIYVKN
jgi:HNH endonuclease